MPDPWPWPGDDAKTRARRLTGAYRAALRANNRPLCDKIDEMAAGYGETWMLEREITTEADGLDEVTTAEAAELAHVSPDMIRKWACTPDPRQPGRMLLPRFGKDENDSRKTTYLVRDVLAAAEFKRGPIGLPQVAA